MSLSVPLRKKKPTMPSFPSTELVNLLPGEITVAQATKVQQMLYFSEKSGCPSYPVLGTLLCTNHRITFLPEDKSIQLPDESGRCLLEASRHIPLSCVDRVNILGNKSRKLLDGVSTLPKHLSHLQILCKDVRKVHFNLKSSPKSESSALVNAIGRHTHPNSVHLLFAYDYTRALKDSRRHHEHYPPSDASPILSFLNARDWRRELHRLGVTNDQWRVSEANKHFLVCESLCPYFPCPTTFADSSLEHAASLHSNHRIPVWCWSHPHTGVSLTRGGTTVVDDDQEAPDPNYKVSIGMARHTDSQVENKGVKMVDILQKCDSVKHLQSAFRKIRDLCTPGNTSELNTMDKHWLGSVDSSGWLNMVRCALVAAKEVTHMLCIKKYSVMLLEESGCDFSCVVSSLVELMADPHYRSITGFEGLVQKEWVALGHPFTTRHCLTAELSADDDHHRQAPVFFLFLDCVWQLSRQFPSAFEFSEYFLIRFYDMVLDCLYSNFLYDSTKHRLQASLHSRRSCFFGTGDDMPDMDDYEGPIFSAWGRWRDSLNEEESERCLNPLYYVFGISETDCDSTASTPLSSQFSSILNDSNNLSDVGKFGLQEVADVGKFGLFSDREVTPVSVNSQDVDYYRHGLLVPETSMCSLSIWDAFFFRYLPELGACHQQLEVQQLESRMVRDVQKLKEELNELELSVGTFTTDLPTCIGEVVEAREKQIMDERRESVEVGMPLRPRLTASIYSYSEITEDDGGAEKNGDKEEIDGSIPATLVDDVTPVNSPHGTPTKNQKPKPQALNGNVSLPVRGAGGAAARQTSLAQFTDALYSSELEDSGGLRPKALAEAQASPVGPSRSPVTKTRLRVVKSQTSDPVVAAWQQNSPRQVIRHKELRIERNVETEKPPQVTSNTQLTQL